MKRTKIAAPSGFKKASIALVPELAEAVADLARDMDSATKGAKVRGIMLRQNIEDAAMEHPDLDEMRSLQASVFCGRLIATRARRRVIEGGSAADGVLALGAIAAKVHALRDEENHLTETIRGIEREALSQAAGIGEGEAPESVKSDDAWLLPSQRR